MDKTKKFTEIEHKTAKRNVWDLTDEERWGGLILTDEERWGGLVDDPEDEMWLDDFWKVAESQEAAASTAQK